MDNRWSASRPLVRVAAAIAILTLPLPSAMLAETPRPAIESGVGSFTVADSQGDGPEARAVLGSMPVATWIVRLTPSALNAVQSSSAVVGLEPYHAAFKLEPSIGRTPLRDPVKALSEV